RLADDLDGGTGPGRPLDADRRGLAEFHVDAEVVRQGLLDDLFLHLSVERHEQLLLNVVLAEVDQGVLLGELRERSMEQTLVGGVARNDDGFERRRGEGGTPRRRGRAADRIAEPNIAG